MTNASQLKNTILILVIFGLISYIIYDKLTYNSVTPLSVTKKPCFCPPPANRSRTSESTPVIGQSSHTTKGVVQTSPRQPLEGSTCPTCQVYDLDQPNDYPMDCIQMRFTPSAPVCLYPVNKDIHVSGSLARSGTWEAGMVAQFQRWIRMNPEAGVIDVGANLGVYSLVAAAMGRDVVSVEPNIHNIHRYHKAIVRGNLQSKITLLQNAISDTAGYAKIVYSSNNQGDTQMRKQPGGQDESVDYTDEHDYTKMIVMNDLTRFCKFPDAIMKIDIQGFEHRAFAHADLLFDKVNIHKVLMEWDMMKPIYRNKRLKPEEFGLVEKMIKFFIDRNYVPKDWNGNILGRHAWESWPFDLVWHKT